MCPEVRNDGPGVCPSCGMALEPETITLEEEDQGNPELEDMTRRFLVALVLTVPVFVIAMGGMLPGFHELLPRNTSRWLEFSCRHRWFCGRAGRFSSAAGNRWPTATPTCSP